MSELYSEGPKNSEELKTVVNNISLGYVNDLIYRRKMPIPERIALWEERTEKFPDFSTPAGELFQLIIQADAVSHKRQEQWIELLFFSIRDIFARQLIIDIFLNRCFNSRGETTVSDYQNEADLIFKALSITEGVTSPAAKEISLEQLIETILTGSFFEDLVPHGGTTRTSAP